MGILLGQMSGEEGGRGKMMLAVFQMGPNIKMGGVCVGRT